MKHSQVFGGAFAIAAALAEASANLRERAASERAALAAAERERALLQSVVDGVADPVFVKDGTGRYALANRAAAAALGARCLPASCHHVNTGRG